MPTIVKPDEVPSFVRAGSAVSQWADALNFLVELFTDPKQPADVSIKYERADGVTKLDWGQMATALRGAAKKLGYKVIVVYRDEEVDGSSATTPVLYVKRDGEPTVLAPEVVEARNAKAEATRQAKLEELAALKPAERAAVEQYVKDVRAERKAAREAEREQLKAEAEAEAKAAAKTTAKK